MSLDFIEGVRKYAKASMVIHKIKQLEYVDRMHTSFHMKEFYRKMIIED